MGRILCASFCPIIPGVPSHPYTLRLDSPRFRRHSRIDDGKLVAAIRDELERYNMIVTWNGKMFDVPFLNARLAKAEGRPVHPQFHCDLMYYAGGVSMRVGSRKLDNVQKFFNLAEAKTQISWDHWNLAAGGDRSALNEVVRHCEADVKVLSEVYWKLLPYVANLHR